MEAAATCTNIFDNLSAEDYSISVSSTLDKNTKDFGKKYILDGKQETCWNSD